MAKVLLDIIKSNGFTIIGSPIYFNNNYNLQLNLPRAREIGAIAQYYQSLLNILKDYNVTIIEEISNVSGRSFNIKFSDKTWEEFKIYAETNKYNL